MPRIEGHTPFLNILRSHYGEVDDQTVLRRAVLDNCYFLDPSVVSQAENLPIFRARRKRGGETPETIVDGFHVSQNLPPDLAFFVATPDTRDRSSVQLCHIYGGTGEARDPFYYTNLANLCLLPNFLVKLSDTNTYIKNLLKGCSFALYNFAPQGEISPEYVDGIDPMQLKKTSLLDIALGMRIAANDSAPFGRVRDVGCLFGADGQIQHNDLWVQEMIARRDAAQI